MIHSLLLVVGGVSALGQMGDAVTSLLAFNKGYVEGNPLWVKIGIKSKTGLFAAKTGVAVVTFFLPLVAQVPFSLNAYAHPAIVAAACAFSAVGGYFGFKQTLKNLPLLK